MLLIGQRGELMLWIILGLAVYFISITLVGSIGSGARSIGSFWGRYLVGAFLGSAAALIITVTIEQIIAPPRMQEFDLLVFPFYIGPMGALLGGLTAVILYRLRVNEGNIARRLLIAGGSPLLLVSGWTLYDFVRFPEQHLGTVNDAIFWLFAFGFPLIWLALLSLLSYRKQLEPLVTIAE